MPVRAFKRRAGGFAMPPTTSELEVDEGICLIRSQESYHQRTRKSEGYTSLHGCRCKTVLVSRRLQVKINQQQWNGEDRQK
jgi:hypothetical protein